MTRLLSTVIRIRIQMRLVAKVGLRDLLRAHFPQKRVLATGYDEPTLTWLAEMDTVSDEDYDWSFGDCL